MIFFNASLHQPRRATLPRFVSQALFAGLVALALTGLTACSGGGDSKATTAVATASPQNTGMFSACTTKGAQSDAKASLGKFMVTTNVWNPNSASGYQECVNAKYDNATGLVDAKITWDATPIANEVLSYPNLAYGWQVGTDQGSTSPKLPATVGNVGDLIASGKAETTCAPGATCTMNTAFELLFSNTPTPNVWPPTAEIMVWLQATCQECNAGKLAGTVTIDGVIFDIYKGAVTPPTGTASWTYVAYVAKTTVTQFNFNFKNFLNDSVTRGYIKSNDYLAVVELGTEITKGQGNTVISGYGIR